MPDLNWTKLDATDFSVKNPDWIPELEAMVHLRDAPVTLTIDGTLEMSPDYAECFKMLIDGWLTNRKMISQLTEKHLERFLPGRKVRSDELLIWGITLRVDGETAEAASFFYRVGGDYRSADYKLDEFDDRSVVELSCCVDDGVVDWTDLDIATTNDFD
ncbi:hypothetical protein RMSM_05570 [Rhodopirellula maiorica SM1]|uniref:Uncharacterized protein n=1 Tax=Rhodopirellula maiorica SM1 TaxID=1265738 RepID=M5RDP5_9BACT|nr:hypothetical protein [Rhodopirellula maiorica]EMI17505.1 hypothetical protein RMSM_05570 [Rhodopirellula maiorica SM1]